MAIAYKMCELLFYIKADEGRNTTSPNPLKKNAYLMELRVVNDKINKDWWDSNMKN